MEVASLPCPVGVNLLDEPAATQIIKSSKSMRAFANIEESSACKTCPIAKKCKLENKPADRDAKFSDVANILHGIYFN